MKTLIEAHLRASSQTKLSLLSSVPLLEQMITTLYSVVSAGGRIYAAGNGGSTCDAMHFTEELVARYDRERPGIAAQHLCDVGTITCWANDYSFDSVFSRQVETLVTNRDALVVFSTSGNSRNILAALEAAAKKGAVTIALLGKGGGKAKSLAKIALVVESDVTAHIQEAHITIVHILCEGLERKLLGI